MSDTMKVHSESIRDKSLKEVPYFIPIGVLSEERAQINHSQSLIRLNERGGMGVLEILDNIHNRKLTYSKNETQADVDELNGIIRKHQQALTLLP